MDQYICIAPYCWGKGKTTKEAIKNAKKNKRIPWMEYIVYKCGPTAYVNGMGDIVRESSDIKLEVVEDICLIK